MHYLSTIAIVGRPNVGKSTLFNRLLGRPLAVVSESPGTTRDRVLGTARWDDASYLLVDTGGLVLLTHDPLLEKVQAQAQEAIQHADLVLLVVDAADGPIPLDQEIAQLLRQAQKPLVVVASKCDNSRIALSVAEFHRLGLGEPLPVSALHNLGIRDLIQAIMDRLPPVQAPAEEAVAPIPLAILGRPNVGKSSLLNRILGEERAIVTETPGTTRDALDSTFSYKSDDLLLIDTAGIRRRGRVQPGVEKFSVLRALQTIERCSVGILVMDATEPAAAQDTHIIGYLLEAYKGLVIALNKWDLAHQAGADPVDLVAHLRRIIHFTPHIPIVFTSALTGEGVAELLETAISVHKERTKHIPRPELNQALTTALAANPPPSAGRNSFMVYKARQTAVDPPTFLLEVNRPERVHFSYQRYLENALRTAFRYRGTRLKLVFKASRGTRKALPRGRR